MYLTHVRILTMVHCKAGVLYLLSMVSMKFGLKCSACVHCIRIHLILYSRDLQLRLKNFPDDLKLLDNVSQILSVTSAQQILPAKRTKRFGSFGLPTSVISLLNSVYVPYM